MSEPIPIICVHVGDLLPTEYVTRLHSMLGRHLERPFRLHCLTDRTLELPADIEQIDVAGWDVRGTQAKTRMFDRSTITFERFFYLDTTIVIRRSVEPLLEFAEASGKSIVTVMDWAGPEYNTCALWVVPDERTEQIWIDRRNGVRYPTNPTKIAKGYGDQDHLTGCVRARGLEEIVGVFPEEHIVSYKLLRKLRRTDRRAERELLHAARVIKFHGHPKPHEMLDPWLQLRYNIGEQPLRAPWHWNYLKGEIERRWR